MKRIIYSCILFISLFMVNNLRAQAWSVTITPAACLYPGGSFVGSAGNQVPLLTATSYSWGVIAPPSGTLTYSVVPGTPLPGDQITFTITGACGIYSLNVFGYNAAGAQVQSQQVQQILYCQPTMTLAQSAPSVCAGSSVIFTAQGVPSVTWQPVNSTSNPFTIIPTANTCYTATGASAVGCTVGGVACVNVQTVNLTISPSQTVCAGLTVTLAANATPPGSIYQWYQTAPLPGSTLGTASTQVVNPGAVLGTVNVYSVNSSFNGCPASATTSVTVGAALSISISASSPSVCIPEQHTLTALGSATSFTWTGPGFSPPTYTAGGNPVIATGPGPYTVVARNGGCFGTATTTVFLTNFIPTITASSASVCPGETFTVTGSGGANAATSYTWGYTSVPGSTVPMFPFGQSTYTNLVQNVPTTYGFLATNSAGCTNTVPVSVLVGITPPLTVTAVSSATSICAGASVTLTASGAASYTWVTPNGTTLTTTGTGSLAVDNPTANTTYSVYGSSATGFCTSAAGTVAVNMTIGGVVSLTLSSSAATICPGLSANLTATSSLANANYSWSPAFSLGSPSNYSTTASPTLNTTYTVTVDNGGGCSGTGTINVGVDAYPVVYIIQSSSVVCAGYTATLTAMGAISYTWMGSTFNLPVYQQTISVSPGTTLSPIATYTVVGSTANGCLSLPAVANVSLAPSLQITVINTSNTNTTCITTNANVQNPYKLSKPINLTATGATNYNWFPTTIPYITYTVGASTTVRPPTSTCYTVVGYTENCSGTGTICITVIPQFTMNVVPLSPILCIGDSVTLGITNVGALALGDPNDFTYNWMEAANAPPPSLDFYGTPTVTAYPQNTTTYTVEMKDARACASLPRLTTVTVLPLPITAVSVPTINNIPTYTLCFVGDIPGAPDNVLVLTARNRNTNPGLPTGIIPTYQWDSPYTPESFVTPSNVYEVMIKAPSRLPASVVYTVTSGYNGVPGCKMRDTITIHVIDCRPVIQSNVLFGTDIEKDVLCTRECLTYFALTDTMAGGPQTYSWTFKGGSPPTSTLATPSVCYNLSGANDVILTVSNPYPKHTTQPGSSATVAFRNYIVVKDIPNVTIISPGRRASDTTIRYGQTLALTATNAITYEWSPPYNISSTTGRDVIVNPYKTTQYVVTGKNSDRCFSSDTINVIVIQDCGDMFIPNAFSPNGDGVNDELKVNGVCLQTLTFMIFNRWGEKVFETNDVNVGWDGTFNGDKLNTGVFVYRLEGKTIEGKGYSSKGNITLVR